MLRVPTASLVPEVYALDGPPVAREIDCAAVTARGHTPPKRDRRRRAISVVHHRAVQLDRAVVDPETDGPKLAFRCGHRDLVVVEGRVELHRPKEFPARFQ